MEFLRVWPPVTRTATNAAFLALVRTLYRDAILIDTSAFIALEDSTDRFHSVARDFFDNHGSPVRWYSLNVTGHEAYTLVRYRRRQSVAQALRHYDLLRAEPFSLLEFTEDDEAETRRLLSVYHDQALSFHDTLCAAVMLREGIPKVFTFDKDFSILGFQVVPGIL